MLPINEVHVSGTEEKGRVVLRFADIDLNLDLETARGIAQALLQQADVAELEEMQGGG